MNLFTADVGQGKVHIYDSGNDEFHPKLPEQNLIDLDIPKLESGDTLVVECAHLRESHRFTMAQPFDWEQLNNLKQNAEEKGVTILLFPQKSTPKTRKLANVSEDKKSDEADTKAIANFLLNDKRAFSSLKKFNPKKLKDFQQENNFIFDYIQQCNEDINPAKTVGYGFNKKIHYEDEISKWIKAYYIQLVSELGDEELVSAIGIKKTTRGYKVDKENVTKRVEVKVGNRNKGYLEVESGLNEGDIVVAEGLKKVRPNGKIKPIKDCEKKSEASWGKKENKSK